MKTINMNESSLTVVLGIVTTLSAIGQGNAVKV